MELALITLNKILIMFVILAVGIVCYKTKIISDSGNKCLANVLLLLVNPLLMFVSYQIDFEMRLLKGFVVSVGFAIISHTVAIIVANAMVKKKAENYEIERLSCIYSNCGFMGIPIINTLFGAEGVLYLSAYMAVFNILLWTHGVILMTGERDIKTFFKALKAPAIIAVVLGLIFFVMQIKIPNLILEPINTIASMNTPLAMIIAGVSLAQTNVLGVIKNIRVYLITVVKLLIIPLVAAVALTLFGFDRIVTLTAIIEVACPTAASATLFAIRFNKNSVYASELYTITTLFSAITIPLVIMMSDMIIG